MVAVSCKALKYDPQELPERVMASIWPRDATFDKFCQKWPPAHSKQPIVKKQKPCWPRNGPGIFIVSCKAVKYDPRDLPERLVASI